jgi:large subunit ribosomal protein L31
MQADIHPHYETITVVCNCGNTFKTRMSYKKSTQLNVEICSECHPFYTGNQKIVDTEGRVESYYSKYQKNSSKES